MKAGKMNNMAGKQSNPVQSKAMKQAHEGSILQAYKKGTAQLATAEEEEPLQGKFETTQLAELGEEDEEPSQLKENNTGLPDNLKSGVENLSGHSLDDVKVHYNSDKPSQLQAHAYAQGTDIHVAPGQEKHLPHEAWHVAQQKQGRVQPTKQMKGNSINDDMSLENEADVMGAKAIQMKSMVVQLAKFVGDEAAVHIHLEGKHYHVKNSLMDDRYDFDPQDGDQIREAYKYMRKNLCAPGKSKGARACAKWFRDNQSAAE